MKELKKEVAIRIFDSVRRICDIIVAGLIIKLLLEAAQRTWQDDNGYIHLVSDVKRGLNRLNFKGYGLGDIVMPFVKTPANLVKAVVDYSPVGVVKALMKDSRNLNLAINTGKGVAAAQRAYVNDLSKGITGTLLLIFYGFLADKGIIKGDASEDKDVRNFERNILGMLPYSVKIGDKTYSYEWAQPVGGILIAKMKTKRR